MHQGHDTTKNSQIHEFGQNITITIYIFMFGLKITEILQKSLQTLVRTCDDRLCRLEIFAQIEFLVEKSTKNDRK